MIRKYKRNPGKVFIKRREVLCSGEVVDGKCQLCEMFLSRNVPHRPRYDGMFGYILTYADGSTYQTQPGESH